MPANLLPWWHEPRYGCEEEEGHWQCTYWDTESACLLWCDKLGNFICIEKLHKENRICYIDIPREYEGSYWSRQDIQKRKVRINIKLLDFVI